MLDIMFQKMFLRRLEKIVRRFMAEHQKVRVVLVAGGRGRHGVKYAVETVLAQRYSTAMIPGAAPRDRIGLLLQIMGVQDGLATSERRFWRLLGKVRAARLRARRSSAQLIIQECVPDEPGFAEWLSSVVRVDFCIVTTVAGYQKKQFSGDDAFAAELINLVNASKYGLLNYDDIDSRYAEALTHRRFATYGTRQGADYSFIPQTVQLGQGTEGYFVSPGDHAPQQMVLPVVGETALHPFVAALSVGLAAGVSLSDMQEDIQHVMPLPGHGNMLRGQRQSWIIDNTEGATYESTATSLRALYSTESPKKIVVLGNIVSSIDEREQLYKAVAEMCHPVELAWVVTIGKLPSQYIAPIARSRGNQVRSFESPIDAGAFVHSLLEKDTVVLYNAVADASYVEEALKITLHSLVDARRLIRQSSSDLHHKDEYFSSLSVK